MPCLAPSPRWSGRFESDFICSAWSWAFLSWASAMRALILGAVMRLPFIGSFHPKFAKILVASPIRIEVVLELDTVRPTVLSKRQVGWRYSAYGRKSVSLPIATAPADRKRASGRQASLLPRTAEGFRPSGRDGLHPQKENDNRQCSVSRS